MIISIQINNENHEIEVLPSAILLNVLRNKLGLTGAKRGCLNGDCGACTFLYNNRPMKSCLLLVVEAHQAEVITIEGLKDTPIQRAFIDKFAFQCGYCTPGFIMNSHALLLNDHNPDKEKIITWLSSNICRCTGYKEIEEAIMTVIESSLKE